MNRFLWLVVFSLLPCVCGAQSPVVPPDPPFRKTAPEGQQCTAEIRYPALEKALASGRKIIVSAYPLRRTFALQKGLTGLEIKYSDDRLERKFRRDGIIMSWDSKNGGGAFPANAENSTDFVETFPELYWVKPGFFKGAEGKEGAKYLAYVDEAGGRRLLIHADTHLPARYEDAGNIYKYSYQPIASDLREIPTDLLAEEKRVQAGGSPK